MQTEIFFSLNALKPNPENQEQTQFLQDLERLERAGFVSARKLKIARRMPKQFKPSEPKAWRFQLPNHIDVRHAPEHLVPPDDVAEALAQARQIGCYDYVEIWSGTSYNNDTCLAVGMIEDDGMTHHFPLVRWGTMLAHWEYTERFYRARRRVLACLVISGVFAALVLGWYAYQHLPDWLMGSLWA